MTERAKFKYSASDGVLELEGSEDFVTKHFDSLTDIIRVISRHTIIEKKESSSIPSSVEQTIEEEEPVPDQINSKQQEEKLSKYPEIYSEINGKLKIVSEIPGGTAIAKMTNAAVLFCYGSKLIGDDQVPSTDIRSMCEEHGILDSGNFSKVFNDKKTFMIDGVKGGNKEVKLTFQGEKKAKELLTYDKSED